MIRIKRPDQKNALSILQAAEREMKFTFSLSATEESGSTIIRNIYECFRMLGDALLVSKGTVAVDHITQIKELLKLNVKTNRPIQSIENLRQLRHNINYYGYRPNIMEIKEAISIAESCFKPLHNGILQEINKK